MERSFGLLFYPKKDSRGGNRTRYIYMRITVDGLNCHISTKKQCNPKHWNTGIGRVNVKAEGSKEINDELDLLYRKVYEMKKVLAENNDPITAENIKTLLMGGSLKKTRYMLMEIFKKHNDQMAALVGREYAAGTLERYNTSMKHTLSFLQYRYNILDIDVRDLDYEFLSEYEFWFKTVRKCEHNSTIKYLANFRKIINRCIRNGWLLRDPFLGFKMNKHEIEKTPLTPLELQALTDKQFETTRLAVVRDIFLFSCYSGLAYADVKKLNRSELIIGMDGEKWLITKRQKTDTTSRIPLLPAALKIIDQYSNHPQCVLDNRVLPVLSNQKMNAYLKEIAELCGINKYLTFHIARHTFATTVTLSNGVPIETVAKMLGHRNLKTTQHYAKILDIKISQDMKSIMNKFL